MVVKSLVLFDVNIEPDNETNLSTGALVSCVQKMRLAIFDKYRNYKIDKKTNFNIQEFLEILWYSLYIKDVFLLKIWFKKNFIISDIKHQKFFLNYFQKLTAY